MALPSDSSSVLNAKLTDAGFGKTETDFAPEVDLSLITGSIPVTSGRPL
jgi:hypothetical protein